MQKLMFCDDSLKDYLVFLSMSFLLMTLVGRERHLATGKWGERSRHPRCHPQTPQWAVSSFLAGEKESLGVLHSFPCYNPRQNFACHYSTVIENQAPLSHCHYWEAQFLCGDQLRWFLEVLLPSMPISLGRRLSLLGFSICAGWYASAVNVLSF